MILDLTRAFVHSNTATKEMASAISDLQGSTSTSGPVNFDRDHITGKAMLNIIGRERVVLKWVLAATERDRDNDIICWEFVPHQDALNTHPHLAGWKFTVLND